MAHSASSGFAPALRILSLFDKTFRAKLEATQIKVHRSESGETAEVEFKDAELYTDGVFKTEKASQAHSSL